MSYKFYSFKDRSQQDIEQWAHRTVEGEIQSCYGRTLTKIFEKFLPNPNIRILEAGCGLGGWVYYFESKGYEIIGVEYEESIVKRVKEYDKNSPIVYGDVNNLDFPDNFFDAYISLGVIEHFEEGPQRALLEAKRVLKPGGLIFVTVPYLNFFRKIIVHPLRDLYFAIRRLQGKNDYFWEYRYTKKELAGFLKDTGFKIIYTAIDDYVREDKKHHIGLYADFFFLREKDGEIWRLNRLGLAILALSKLFSPWIFCSGVHMVAKNKKAL